MKKTLGLTLALTGALAIAGCGGNGGSSGGTAGSTGGNGTGGSTGGVATGGNGTGGSTGGVATGGNGTGGGTGGVSTGGNGTGGSTSATPQCTFDGAPCQLVNDCCSCLSIGPGESAPPCDVPECFVDTCTALQLEKPQEPHCAAGQCVAGFVCAAPVICEQIPPSCPPGETPSVQGSCWGPCVPAAECLSVPSCFACTGGLVCVQNETMLGYEFHCVPPAEGCGADITCDCMGAAVCAGAYHQCTETDTGLMCSCPEC